MKVGRHMKKQIAFLLACAAAVSACPRELVTAAEQPEAETAAVTGDLNADGVFSAADLVFQQLLFWQFSAVFIWD